MLKKIIELYNSLLDNAKTENSSSKELGLSFAASIASLVEEEVTKKENEVTASFQSSLDSINKTIESQGTTISELKASNEGFKTTLNELKSSLETVTKEKDQAIDQNTELSEQVTTLETEKANLEAANLKLSNESGSEGLANTEEADENQGGIDVVVAKTRSQIDADRKAAVKAMEVEFNSGK